MRIPERLVPLFEEGIIDEVVRPLMSGKEAQIYLVVSEGELRVAKVYKEANQRSFKHRADYTEGRRTRNTRDQRAMNRRSKHGRAKVEAAWRNAEADYIYRLQAAGVRVPQPYAFVEGVLVMELVEDVDGSPAPRLVDLQLEPDEAEEIFFIVLQQAQLMLCAGVVHGDLSDFNVLVGRDGPVLIDFPQAVDSAHNRNARRLLIRDINNLVSFLARFADKLRGRRYGEEMWDLYERGMLGPDTELTGNYCPPESEDKTDLLLEELRALELEHQARREALGLEVRPARKPVAQPKLPQVEKQSGGRSRRRRGGGGEGRNPERPTDQPGSPDAEASGGRRRRRRGGGSKQKQQNADAGAPTPQPPKGKASAASKRRRRRRRGGGRRDGGGGGQTAPQPAGPKVVLRSPSRA